MSSLPLSLALMALLPPAAPQARPISLHPENPHYFEFRGEPTILVTSGEHYGAVLNLDFDFLPYLDELQTRGFNQTRTFSGTYYEVPGSFKIQHNTLAPKPERYQSPWVKAEDGRYDLDRFDPGYFDRLRAFVSAAGERGIVVEYVLFCPFYNDDLWAVNPMNARNNVNGVGDFDRTEAYTLDHPELLEKQLAFVRRAVRELREFDNVYFEVCNEPYFGGVTGEWQDRIIAEIVEAESDLEHPHLIARNIANEKAEITDPNPAVSLFNFHYAAPEAALANLDLNKALGDDETGFDGNDDRPYRTEAWRFLLSGGALFGHLDYSFTPDHEDGSAPIETPTPGGGGPTFRGQLAFLKRFLESFDFLRMSPEKGFLSSVEPAGMADELAAMAVPDLRAIALYAPEGPRLSLGLDLPALPYRFEWIDPRTGAVLASGEFEGGDGVSLDAPEYDEDIALGIEARE
ncbi:hypothetical protein [Tautonia plasticadhaerens]|uniref:Glycoside hydrolase family 5 domain-containing protein n=1 Tax=Tautonia plasticadhaerens TaxID=2527974 RepID=A0A518HC50_9BACT|nr:hypothetical protein [Tautonia plasticadhaerens]QDV38442.1 hypothetical protein ElP_63970 [Tautonia plasticadhaerens]